jgi:hypothetical protein
MRKIFTKGGPEPECGFERQYILTDCGRENALFSRRVVDVLGQLHVHVLLVAPGTPIPSEVIARSRWCAYIRRRQSVHPSERPDRDRTQAPRGVSLDVERTMTIPARGEVHSRGVPKSRLLDVPDCRRIRAAMLRMKVGKATWAAVIEALRTFPGGAGRPYGRPL